jgi:phosphoribosylglycinamide formyltransferase-1
MAAGIRIGVLLSSKGNKLQAILDACEAGRISGRVVFVGSDNYDAYGLERARRHNLPWFVVDYAWIRRRYREHPEEFQLPGDFELGEMLAKQELYPVKGKDPEELTFLLQTRAIAEVKILEHMAPYPFDLLVLAGFMRKLTPYFIEKVNRGSQLPRIMNMHATLSPAFPGINGYGRTFRHGCKVGGCTVHFVDYGVDSGPIIEQEAFKIDPNDTADSVKAKGLKLECTLYPKCIQLVAEKRLELKKNEVGRIVVGILPEPQ